MNLKNLSEITKELINDTKLAFEVNFMLGAFEVLNEKELLFTVFLNIDSGYDVIDVGSFKESENFIDLEEISSAEALQSICGLLIKYK